MIRPAVAADAPALGLVHVRSWQTAYEGLLPAEYLAGLSVDSRIRWFERMILQGSSILVAECEAGVVGFALMDEGGDGWAEILAIYVDPDHWGAGHGHRLMIASEELMRDRGYGRASLWVLDANERARSFYERQGWSLGTPIRLEEIGGAQVTEVRYDRDLSSGCGPDPGHPEPSL